MPALLPPYLASHCSQVHLHIELASSVGKWLFLFSDGVSISSQHISPHLTWSLWVTSFMPRANFHLQWWLFKSVSLSYDVFRSARLIQLSEFPKPLNAACLKWPLSWFRNLPFHLCALSQLLELSAITNIGPNTWEFSPLISNYFLLIAYEMAPKSTLLSWSSLTLSWNSVCFLWGNLRWSL